MREPTRLLQQMFSLVLIADAASVFLNARTSHAKTRQQKTVVVISLDEQGADGAAAARRHGIGGKNLFHQTRFVHRSVVFTGPRLDKTVCHTARFTR